METYWKKLRAGIVMLLTVLAAPAGAEEVVCERTGRAVQQQDAVVVTDWESNARHNYGGLACAILSMGEKHRSSRALALTADGKPVRLSLSGGRWLSEPERALAVLVENPAEAGPQLLALGSYQDLSLFTRNQKQLSLWVTRTIPLVNLHQETALLRKVCGDLPDPAAAVPPEALPVDVPADHWAAGAVSNSVSKGLIRGYPDGTFRGNEPLSRYEAAMLLDRLDTQAGEPDASAERADSVQIPPQPEEPADSPATDARALAGPEVGTGMEGASSTTFYGIPGTLLAPSASTLAPGEVAAGYSTSGNANIASAAMGASGGLTAGAAVTTGDYPSSILLNAHYALRTSGPWGTRAAIGILDALDDIDASAYAVLTAPYSTRFAGATRHGEVSAGIGSGELLDGPFLGISMNLGRRTMLLGEWAETLDGRAVNMGIGYEIMRNGTLKVGVVEDELATSLSVRREF